MSASDNDPAGDLLIQEVDEELRREQYHQLWKRYGKWAIASAVVVVLIVAGYQGWQTWQTNLRKEESAKFAAAQELVEQGKSREGLDALARLGSEGRTGFAVAARMRRIDLLAEGGDVAAAAAACEEIAGSSSAPVNFRDLAVIKLALLSVDTADPATLEGRLAPLAVAANPWHFSATEALALLARKKGDLARAAQLYKQLADDLQAPPAMRARAAEMLAVLGPVAEKAKG